VQEAYQLEWDKEAKGIQSEYASIAADDSQPIFKRAGAEIGSVWKEFTGTMAGGLRGVTETMADQTQQLNSQQQENLETMARNNNKEAQHILELQQDETFKAMSKKDQKKALKQMGLSETMKMARDDGGAVGWLQRRAENVSAAGKNMWQVMKDGDQGRLEGKVKGQIGSDFSKNWQSIMLDKDKVSSLHENEEYQKAIDDGKDEKEALKAAYVKQEFDKKAANGEVTKKNLFLETQRRKEEKAAKRREAVMGGMRTVGKAVGDVGELTGKGLLKAGRFVGGKVAGAAGYAWDKAKGAARGAVDGVVNSGVGKGVQAVGSKLKQGYDAVTGWYDETAVGKMGNKLRNSFKLGVSKAVEETRENLSILKDKGVGALLKKRAADFKGVFTGAAESVQGMFAKGLNLVKDSRFVKGLGKAMGGVKDNVVKAAENVRGLFGRALEGVKKAPMLSGFGTSIKNVFETGLDRIRDGFHSAVDWATERRDEAAAAVGGARDAIVSRGRTVLDTLDGLFNRGTPAVAPASRDAVISKDGTLYPISDDDNVYATTNPLSINPDSNVRDAAAVPASSGGGEFTDVNIVAALQQLIQAVSSQRPAPIQVSVPSASGGGGQTAIPINFNQYRSFTGGL
jgi:hypothetical protein